MLYILKQTNKIFIKIKCLYNILIILIILYCCSIKVFANDNISLLINGQKVYPNTPIYIEDGTALIPFKFICEELCASAQWIPETKELLVSQKDSNIKLQIGNDTAYVNNNPISLLVPPKIINNHTYVPLRFLGEAMNATVNYAENTINLEYQYNFSTNLDIYSILNEDGTIDISKCKDSTSDSYVDMDELFKPLFLQIPHYLEEYNYPPIKNIFIPKGYNNTLIIRIGDLGSLDSDPIVKPYGDIIMYLYYDETKVEIKCIKYISTDENKIITPFNLNQYIDAYIDKDYKYREHTFSHIGYERIIGEDIKIDSPFYVYKRTQGPGEIILRQE